MDIEKILTEAYANLLKLIDNYEAYFNGTACFIPSRNPSWERLPTPDELRKASKFLDTAQKRLTYWNNIREMANVYFDETIISSSPQSFLHAYKNFSGVDLSTLDLALLKNMGANILPMDPTLRNNPPSGSHHVFRNLLGGIRYFPMNVKVSIMRACVSTGKYQDKTQMDSLFYDTAVGVNSGPKSVIHYRFFEFLSDGLFRDDETGLLIQLVVKLQNKTGHSVEEYSTAMIASFCEIQPISTWWDELVKTELVIYGHKMLFPMLLKPLGENDARTKINLIRAIADHSDDDDPYDVRTRLLTPEEVRKWSYTSINEPQRKMLWDCIITHGIKCGHHDDSRISITCRGINSMGDMHVGHILSQKWSKSYQVFSESVHHPDNLYLSCKSCNSSLSYGGPSRDVLQYLNENFLTIGDLLRTNRLN